MSELERSMSELDRIRSRAEAAAKGPWRIERHDLSLWVQSEDDQLEANLGYVGNHPEANAEFIAHARGDVPKLLAALVAVLELADAIIAESSIAPQYGRDIKWAVAGALSTVPSEDEEAIETVRRILSKGAYQMTPGELPYATQARAVVAALKGMG